MVVPSKNAEQFVGDALESLARQFEDARDLEIVFVNDGSTDSTLAVAQSFSAVFPHFEVIDNAASKGAYESRNQGMRVARGRYVSFLDADDWFAPGHLAVLADAMARLDCDFVRTDVIKAWGTKRLLRRAPQARRDTKLPPRDAILPVDTYTMVDHPWSQAGMYHRRMIDQGLLTFPLGIQTAEDRPWIWGMFLNAASYAVVDSPGFVWRKGVPTSLTASLDRKRLGYLEAMDSVRVLVEADREAERFMPKVIQSVLALTEHHLDHWDLLPEDVRQDLVAGAQDLLLRFPPAAVEERVVSLPPERAARLERVLGGFEPVREGR